MTISQFYFMPSLFTVIIFFSFLAKHLNHPSLPPYNLEHFFFFKQAIHMLESAKISLLRCFFSRWYIFPLLTYITWSRSCIRRRQNNVLSHFLCSFEIGEGRDNLQHYHHQFEFCLVFVSSCHSVTANTNQVLCTPHRHTFRHLGDAV